MIGKYNQYNKLIILNISYWTSVSIQIWKKTPTVVNGNLDPFLYESNKEGTLKNKYVV